MADQAQPNYHHAPHPHRTISSSQIMTILTVFPLGGLLLLLACITLTGTTIALVVATPLFLIFSPVLVPAVVALALAVTGLLTSGAFGVTAVSSLAWLVRYLRRGVGDGGGHAAERGKRRVRDTAGYGDRRS